MKKLISVLLAVICIVSLVTTAFAADPDLDAQRRSALIKAKPVSVGFNTLVDEFTVTTASNGMKYAYYNPVIDSEDTVKYPVVIYIHGLFHGWTDRTLRKSGLTYWASREMQDKFAEGGAHLIMPKMPEFLVTGMQTENVYTIIREYIEANRDSVDETQIYVSGGSAGGGLAWRLIIAHPETFAAAVILCSTKTATASDARKVADIPIWKVSATTDPLVNIAGQSATWNNICNNSNVKEKCRWSTFSGSVTLPDGSHPGLTHFLAKTIGFDFCLISSHSALPGMSTCTGDGKDVSISYGAGIINWLQTGNAKLRKAEVQQPETDEETTPAAELTTPEEEALPGEAAVTAPDESEALPAADETQTAGTAELTDEPAEQPDDTQGEQALTEAIPEAEAEPAQGDTGPADAEPAEYAQTQTAE